MLSISRHYTTIAIHASQQRSEARFYSAIRSLPSFRNVRLINREKIVHFSLSKERKNVPGERRDRHYVSHYVFFFNAEIATRASVTWNNIFT